ncbi:MAG: EAL domain-containing protein [Myxococcota bacterium]
MSTEGRSHAQPIRTLYVDDDALARESFQSLLGPFGFDITVASSGFEARRIAESGEYELVVSDLRMPGMDGITLASALEQAGIDAAFVLVSGVPELDFRRRSADSIFSIVPKPWDAEKLAHTLQHAGQFHRDRRSSRFRGGVPTPLLLIENSNSDAALFAAQLGDEGQRNWAVNHVRDTGQAILAMREHTFPVIVTDINLPDARGIHAVQRLREEAPESALIVLSDRADDALGRRIIALGAQEVLVKTQLAALSLPRVVSFALERKVAERRLAHLANRDPVTGLSNRQHFNQRLSDLLGRARRKSRPFGVIYIDLDGFKPINDTYGHDVGDRVLEVVGERISNAVRDYDVCARLGGDEFAVLAEEPTDATGVKIMCERILEELEHSIEALGHTVEVSGSIGAALFPEFGDSAEKLLKAADAAMYTAKEGGGGRICVRAQPTAAKEDNLAVRVRRAAASDEFELHYQPQVHAESGGVVGVEGLLRWRPRGGSIPPSTFVPVLENTGLIVDVGDWVISQMCEQLTHWDRSGVPGLRGAVNVSPRQFETGELVSVVDRALSRTGLDPLRLEIEITESTLMRNTRAANSTLKQLKKIGVRVAIDDFGTGYSSLSYLHRFQVDALKIDRSFIRSLSSDTNGEAIASAIISLSHRLGLEVVAEGVEEQGHVDFLIREGCPLAQGFFYARPMAAEKIPTALKLLRQRVLPAPAEAVVA